jgi:hypothetical protein
MKKYVFLSLFAVIAIIFFNCSKSGDPTPSNTNPVVVTNLDLVKATLKGTWTFKNVTVIQGLKTATTSTCAKTELKVSGLFSDTIWDSLTPEPNYTYSGTNNVAANYPCLLGNPTDMSVTWTLNSNVDGTVTIKFSNGDTFIINTADISTNLIKLSKVNTFGYVIIIQFTK